MAFSSKKIYSVTFIHDQLYMINYITKKIIFPVFAFSVAVLLLLSPLLYYSSDIGFYTTHFSQTSQQNLTYVQNVYSFLEGKVPLDPVFTPNEQSHLQDVYHIFHMVVVWEIIVMILFFLCLLLFILQKKISYIITWFLWGSCIILGLFVLLSIFLIFDFQTIFIFFHQIFFPQGNWSFDQSSILIHLFPLMFFKDIALRIFLTSIAMALVIFLVDIYQRKYLRSKR